MAAGRNLRKDRAGSWGAVEVVGATAVLVRGARVARAGGGSAQGSAWWRL